MGTSSIARSLNLAAVDRGMLSVLIEVQADGKTLGEIRPAA